MSAAPDLAEAVLGWRVWRVARRDGQLRLRSVLRDDVWLPRRPFVARCDAHEAPAEMCGCGVHALRDRATAARYTTGRPDSGDVGRVLGLVALWGWVLEAEHGWRASHAYPSRLVEGRPGELAAEAAAAYAVAT